MLCCVCKKNQAETICEKTTDEKTERRYYCSDCYRRLFESGKRRLSASTDVGGEKQTPQNDVNNFNNEESGAAAKKARCPFCGTSVLDYESTRLLGCPECYRYLFDYIKDGVFLMQGGEPHSGKKPQEFIRKNARQSPGRSGKDETTRINDKGRV